MSYTKVALRKESVDRNWFAPRKIDITPESLSARRAWIEIVIVQLIQSRSAVALRKESVDRNINTLCMLSIA